MYTMHTVLCGHKLSGIWRMSRQYAKPGDLPYILRVCSTRATVSVHRVLCVPIRLFGGSTSLRSSHLRLASRGRCTAMSHWIGTRG